MAYFDALLRMTFIGSSLKFSQRLQLKSARLFKLKPGARGHVNVVVPRSLSELSGGCGWLLLRSLTLSIVISAKSRSHRFPPIAHGGVAPGVGGGELALHISSPSPVSRDSTVHTRSLGVVP